MKSATLLRTTALPFILSSLITALAAPLMDAPAQAEDKTAARDHWERGTKYYDLGKYDEAIREFEAAYEAKGDPAFLYNLAQSHRLAGHPADSLRFYRTYLRYVPKAPNRADIELRIKELEKVIADRPGGDTPAMTAPPPAASVTPATTPPPATGAGNVAPGPAAATAPAWPAPSAPGAPTMPAASTATEPPPGAFSSAPPPAMDTAAAPPQKSGRKTAGIVIAAVGGGLVVIGAIFGAVAKSQSNKVETAAYNGERFDPSVENLGKSSEAVQWVGYGLGLAAVATGIVLYVTAPHHDEMASTPRVALGPLAAPGTGGATLRVRF